MLFFYKFLARRPDAEEQARQDKLAPQLFLPVPDTVVYNDADEPLWIYTASDGRVARSSSFLDKHVLTKMGSPHRPDDIVAVLKTAEIGPNGFVGNNARMLSTKELNSLLPAYSIPGGEACAVQRFVKAKGANAYILRCVWRRIGGSCCWMLSNRKRMDDQTAREEEKFVLRVTDPTATRLLRIRRGPRL